MLQVATNHFRQNLAPANSKFVNNSISINSGIAQQTRRTAKKKLEAVMKTKKAINPTQVRERRVRVKKLKSFCNSPIISQNKPKSQECGYQKLINHVTSGNLESAKEYIELAGYSGVLAEFLLGNAELDAKLEILAAVMPVGCGDE